MPKARTDELAEAETDWELAKNLAATAKQRRDSLLIGLAEDFGLSLAARTVGLSQTHINRLQRAAKEEEAPANE